MKRTRRLRALMAVLLVLGGLAMFNAGTASAAPTTTSSDVTLAGTSAQQEVLHAEAFCDNCFPDDLFSCGGCEVAGGGKLDVRTAVGWTAPVDVATTVDPDKLRQGSTTDVTTRMTPGAGTITINYDIPYQVGLFGRNGDFPAGPDWHPTSEYTLIDSFTVSTSAPCTPALSGDGTGTCDVTDTITLLPETCFFVGCPLDITIKLEIHHVFTITPAGIVAHRMMTYTPDADINFNGPAPAVVTEPLTVPCEAKVGDDVTYDLSGFTYQPSVSVAGAAKIVFDIDGPGPLNAAPELDLASGNVFAGIVPMSGSPAAHVVLGQVQLDNVEPTIVSVLQSGTFIEGSDVAFSVVATDNCASTLDYAWRFSDGGRAFNNEAHHSFADDGSGYTGRVVVTDEADNQAVHDFNVNPIANAAPSASVAPAAAADWGRPVRFHADAVDPGPADQPTLRFTWNFGDGASATGPDVSHAYANPGSYDVTLAVSDKDGAVGNAGLVTTVSQRDTTVVYTGATQALPNKYATLAATLSDEYGQPVVGRSVLFTLGSQSVSGITNSSGLASVVLRMDQKTGVYPLAASFSGDSRYLGAATPALSFRIGK